MLLLFLFTIGVFYEESDKSHRSDWLHRIFYFSAQIYDSGRRAVSWRNNGIPIMDAIYETHTL